MNAVKSWPHKWFGVWKEYGAAYEACPSVQTFVDAGASAQYDKPRLRQYLTSAPIVASASRINFPCPFTGKRTAGTISFRTDGRWLWLDDLPDYIDKYDLAIPAEFLHDIESNNYLPPLVGPDAVKQLEWPQCRQT
jgi:hypothetical protein